MEREDEGAWLEGLLAAPAVRVLREVAAGRDVVVSLHDSGGRVLWASREGLEQVLGWSGVALPDARPWARLIHERDVARVRSVLAGVADGETAEFEFRARHADGRWSRLRSVAWALESSEDVAVIAVTVPAERQG